jgi:hypothetical protein
LAVKGRFIKLYLHVRAAMATTPSKWEIKNDVQSGVSLTLSRRSFVSKITVTWNTRKCNFIYADTKIMAVPAPIFKKFVLQSNTEFNEHPTHGLVSGQGRTDGRTDEWTNTVTTIYGVLF